MYDTANFPTSLWAGLSLSAERKGRLQDTAPDSQDWNQIVAELIAMQTRSINFKQALTFGLVPSTLVVGTDKSSWIYVPNNMTLLLAVASVKTAPTGDDIIVDIMRDSAGTGASFTTIWSTTGNRPTIADGEKVGISAAPDTLSLAAGDLLRLDVIQIGSTETEGLDLSVTLYGYPR